MRHALFKAIELRLESLYIGAVSQSLLFEGRDQALETIEFFSDARGQSLRINNSQIGGGEGIAQLHQARFTLANIFLE